VVLRKNIIGYTRNRMQNPTIKNLTLIYLKIFGYFQSGTERLLSWAVVRGLAMHYYYIAARS
jgi:hypothetical protein